jgi:hypothetical protein
MLMEILFIVGEHNLQGRLNDTSLCGNKNDHATDKHKAIANSEKGEKRKIVIYWDNKKLKVVMFHLHKPQYTNYS